MNLLLLLLYLFYHRLFIMLFYGLNPSLPDTRKGLFIVNDGKVMPVCYK